MSILHFVSSSVWKSLFGKAADSLERSIDHTDEFMIIDYEPIASTFVSVPTDLGQLSADAYVSFAKNYGLSCNVDGETIVEAVNTKDKLCNKATIIKNGVISWNMEFPNFVIAAKNRIRTPASFITHIECKCI